MALDKSKALRAYLNSLNGQLQSLEAIKNPTGQTVIDESLVESVGQDVTEIEAAFPGLIPPFEPTKFFSHDVGRGAFYKLAGLVLYIKKAIGRLEAASDDAVGDASASEIPATSGVWDLIHPAISTVTRQKFEDGHYADAAETAFKAVNTRVKSAWKAAGETEKDGKALMLSAFSPAKPTIRLDDLSTDSGRNVQEGYMHIFAGAIQAIRNPKAHDIITITPDRALHFLVIASLLMCKLDEAGA